MAAGLACKGPLTGYKQGGLGVEGGGACGSVPLPETRDQAAEASHAGLVEDCGNSLPPVQL